MSFTNRLIHEKSPYLLQHARNPVDWFPWGEEAFTKARRENKCIFLSIGYSTCHWCHVMERESFENETIAALLNENFVSIKVDREERPDIDRVYMTFVQATTGSGGWPMSVWLTPDLQPFAGGTYFPPRDSPGGAGLPTVLRRVTEAWQKDSKNIRSSARDLMEKLQDFRHTDNTTSLPVAAILSVALKEMEQRFDRQNGGFGSAPKFPRPSELFFLFHEQARGNEDKALSMAAFTLEKMAGGGMHDHLGGGFHRYSVDARWHVPHFEKMLYDQAQLAEAYLIGGQMTGRADFHQVARGILDYVRRDLMSPGGGFYSAEDADSLPRADASEKIEGAFYVWTEAEIAAALTAAEAGVFKLTYQIQEQGNVARDSDPRGELAGNNVLHRQKRLASTAEEKLLDSARARLLQIRNQRPRPHLDDKIITAWNGMMISAFARGHQILDEPLYYEAARQAALFLEKHLQGNDGLLRCWRGEASPVPAFAEDHACLIRGLLDLYESDFDTRWLKWALELQEQQDRQFRDETDGLYFNSNGRDDSVLLRLKESYDGAEPSANALAALNLQRLGHWLGQPVCIERGRQILQSLSQQLQRSPATGPLALAALRISQAAPRQIVIAGDPAAADTLLLLRKIRRQFRPGTVLVVVDDDFHREFPAAQAGFYGTLKRIAGRATAYVCENCTCQLPVTDPEKLWQILL